jgi:NADH-quinone oxidoreductase subunit M
MDQHLLSIVLFAPLAGFAVLLLIPGSQKNLIKVWANLVGFVSFLISLPLVSRFDKSLPGFQFQERADWIPALAPSF